MSERENEEMMNLMDSTLPFAELYERSKDDRAIIVGSEVREVIGAYRRCLRSLGELERVSTPPVPQEGPSENVADLEMELRKLMWLGHFHSGLYGDDGEMQCGECAKFGVWDYRNQPLDDVRKAFNAALTERAGKAWAEMDAKKAASHNYLTPSRLISEETPPSHSTWAQVKGKYRVTDDELNALEELLKEFASASEEMNDWLSPKQKAARDIRNALDPITVGKMIEEIRVSRRGQKPDAHLGAVDA